MFPFGNRRRPRVDALVAYSRGLRVSEAEDIALYQRAIQLDPNFAMAYERLGAAEGDVGDIAAARQNFRKAYELHQPVSIGEQFLITCVVPAIGLTVGMWFLPDSPRWLISKSRTAEARKALARLRSPEEIGQEVADIEQSTAKTSADWKTELFQPSLRMPLLIGIGLALFQQLSGINTVIYYAPTIFKFAGFQSARAAILGAVGLGVVMLCSHVVAIVLIDRVGRRPLLLVGIAGQILGLAALGAAFHFKQLSSSVGDIAVGSLVVYVACFAFGLGPIFWLLISEIYPSAVRGAAMSTATVANWGMNLAVAVTFLTLVDTVGHSATFWIYGAITVCAWVFIYKLVPETKGKTLEQIEESWQTGGASKARAHSTASAV